MVAFVEKYCSWVEEIFKRTSANARGVTRGHSPEWPSINASNLWHHNNNVRILLGNAVQPTLYSYTIY